MNTKHNEKYVKFIIKVQPIALSNSIIKTMKLTLKNIISRDSEKNHIFMSVEINYGWGGEMLSGIIRINYQGDKGKVYLTVDSSNPGIGSVVNRMIDSLKKIEYEKNTKEHYPLAIIESLAEDFGMNYETDTVKNFFKDFW